MRIAFDQTIVILQKYIDENKKRHSLMPDSITGYNENRVTLFSSLIADIQVRAEMPETEKTDLEKLQEIEARLTLTKKYNQDRRVYKQRADKSDVALTHAIDCIKTGIIIELGTHQLTQEIEQAHERLFAEHFKINTETQIVELHSKLKIAEETAAFEAKKAKSAEEQAQLLKEAALINEALAKQQADADAARKQVEREEAITQHEAAQYISRDQWTMITQAIYDNNFNETDIDELISALEMSVDTHSVPLSEKQEIFYRDLKTELMYRKIPVSPAVLKLLVLSPLADRYAMLTTDVTVKQGGIALRKMMDNIVKILNTVFFNDQNLLGDHHQLLLLQNEETLETLLRLLEGKRMVSVHPNPFIDRGVLSPLDAAIYPTEVVRALMPTQTTSKLDIQSVSDIVSALDETTKKRVDAAQDVNEIEQEIEHVTNTLINYVRTCAATSLLIDNISQRNQSSIQLAENATYAERYAYLGMIVDDYLEPQFAHLMRLMAIMQTHSTALTESRQKLKSLYESQHAALIQRNDETVARQVQELTVLLKSYDEQHQHAWTIHDQLMGALETLKATLDPTVGHDTSQQISTLAQTAHAEANFKARIAEKIDTVIETAKKAVYQRRRMVAPAPAMPEPVKETQALTLAFLTKLANRLNDNQHDCEPAIDLIRLLQNAGLFTPTIQTQLLNHDNLDTLLRLQRHLSKMDAKPNAVELAELWNTLHGDPEFDLMIPLQRQLALDPKTILHAIGNLSQTWHRSLSLLTCVFEDKKADPSIQLCFTKLIDAAKNDNNVIEKIFSIYQAIARYQPAMLNDFFNPTKLQLLLDTLAEYENRFANEMVVRLEASDVAPFSPNEDFTHLIQRTRQYDTFNLSYVTALMIWKQGTASEARGSFDRYSQLLFDAFELPTFKGPHQVNVKPLKIEQHASSDPHMENTRIAQWYLACAYALSMTRPITYDSHEMHLQQKLEDRIHLNPTQQYLLELMRMAFEPGGTLIQDKQENPRYVAWLNASRVGTPEDTRFMDSYVVLTIQALQSEINRFMEQAKGMSVNEVAALFAEKKETLLDTAAQHVRKAFELSTPEATAVASPTLVAKSRNTVFAERQDSARTTPVDTTIPVHPGQTMSRGLKHSCTTI